MRILIFFVLFYKKIKKWAGGQYKIAYASTDDSAVEQLGVKNAFLYSHFVGHILCMIHSECTVKCQFNMVALQQCYEEL